MIPGQGFINDSRDLLASLATEQISDEFSQLDQLDPKEIAQWMIREDSSIAAKVAEAAGQIGKLVEEIVPRMSKGGRLLYFGAGTSGRLGVVDASECAPTFHSPFGQVAGFIAGGQGAMFRAVEGAEDSLALGAGDLDKIGADERDIVIGIAASGRTPYVIGVLEEAKRRGCLRGVIAAVKQSEISRHAEHIIEVETGPEVLAGSTRLKAGTMTKLVLNMISTATMVCLGKTHGNLMVDMRASNEKLRKRAIRLVSRACRLDLETAKSLLESCQGELKTAIVCHELKVDSHKARKLLQQHCGVIRKVLVGKGEQDPGNGLPLSNRGMMAVGIDGGGTGLKLQFQSLEDGVGSPVENGPSCLPGTHGLDGTAFEWIRRIKGWLISRGLSKESVGAIVAGTSGGGTVQAQETLKRYLSEAFPTAKIEVGSDAGLIGMAGGDPHGLVLIAGTGSISWWEPSPGQVFRAGGWGPGADEGSGAWLAEEAIRMVSRGEDGRGPQTHLRNSLLRETGKETVRELVAWLKGAPRDEVAGLSRVILEQAKLGDPVAVILRQNAIRELVELVRATVVSGSKGGQDLPHNGFAAGGLFRDEDFWEGFLNEVRQGDLQRISWKRVLFPVNGAVERAHQMLKEGV